MRIRTLRLEEYERLLDLLDLWPLDDGWQGRDFFRRYMEDDPSFSVRNVWVAIDGENRLRSCVQIFPRSILLRGQAVRCGGIGSVFTHPDARRQGLAEDLLKAAVVAMTQRGFEVSLLFAARIAWYTKLGWRSLERPAWYLSSPRAGRVDRRQVAIRPFDAPRDMSSVCSIRSEYCAELDGPALRDAEAWSASLLLAGNPDEDFLVAQKGDEVVAYARSTTIAQRREITELGYVNGAVGEMAQTLVALLQSASGEALLVHSDCDLLACLEQRGVGLRRTADASLMLRVLDSEALARRVGLQVDSKESARAALWQDLVGGQLSFWSADRF